MHGQGPTLRHESSCAAGTNHTAGALQTVHGPWWQKVAVHAHAVCCQDTCLMNFGPPFVKPGLPHKYKCAPALEVSTQTCRADCAVLLSARLTLSQARVSRSASLPPEPS